MTDPLTATQAVENARNALKRGDKLSTRRWSEHAIALAPDYEDAWLLMAAVASPRASIGYLEQALRINPSSPRALKGMEWAQARLAQTAQTMPTRSQRTARPSTPRPIATRAEIARRKFRLEWLAVVIVLIVIGGAAWSGWNPGALIPITGADSDHPQAWSPVDIAKPSYTPTVTPTFTPTFTPTPTATPTNTPTDTPTSTPTETITISPTPFLPATDTPVTEPPAVTDANGAYRVQAGDTLNKIARRFNVDAYALAAYNKISLSAIIYTGQLLYIPDSSYIPPAQPDTSVPGTTSPGGYGTKRILVDISEQHLYAYEGDVLVYSFVASTGMNNATRTGTFRVLDKIPNAYGATWNIWMPNWMGIYWAGSLENGIHALPILPNGQYLWAGYLGTPISYGCVVLGVYDSQLLYNWAEIGTPVIIQW